MPKWNILKTVRELNEASQETAVELIEPVEHAQDRLLDRGDLDIARLVQPEGLTWEENWCKVGDEYTCSFWIHTYPSQVEDAWLHPFLNFQHALDVAIYIQPLPVSQFVRRRENEIAQDKAAVQASMEEQRRPNAKKLRKIQDTQELLDAIENEVTHPFHIIIALTLRAPDLKTLERASSELVSRMTSVQLRRCHWRHKQGFETTVPLMMNELMDTDNVRFAHTQALMALFPFTSSDITHETGVLLGISRATRSPIIVDRFYQPPVGDLDNPNEVIFGRSGSGKSFFAKSAMTRWVYKGVNVIVLDPSGEYVRVCEQLGGVNITISLDSQQAINPLDFSHAVEPGRNALRGKIAQMSDLLRVMLRSGPDKTEIDSVGKMLFENALIETYRRFGYRSDDLASQQIATSQNMPRLSDVYRMLARIARSDRRQMIQERAQSLLAGLARFVGDGPMAGLFDRHTTVNVRGSHFINFNIAAITQMGQDLVPMCMQLVLQFLRTVLFTDARQEGRDGYTCLYVDEAQHAMAYPETQEFLVSSVRVCRKYGVGMTFLTQDVGVFVLGDDGGENKAGRAILSNCSTSILLKQHPNELPAVQKAFDLTPGEVSRLSSAAIGEGLITVGGDSAWFTARGLAHPAEERMFETSVSARRAYLDEDAALLEAGNVTPQLPPGLFVKPGDPPAALPPSSQPAPQPYDPDDPFAGVDSPFGGPLELEAPSPTRDDDEPPDSPFVPLR